MNRKKLIFVNQEFFVASIILSVSGDVIRGNNPCKICTLLTRYLSNSLCRLPLILNFNLGLSYRGCYYRNLWDKMSERPVLREIRHDDVKLKTSSAVVYFTSTYFPVDASPFCYLTRYLTSSWYLPLSEVQKFLVFRTTKVSSVPTTYNSQWEPFIEW